MSAEPMNAEVFDSVFDALADTSAEAANLTARADLLLSIRERVKAWNVPQDQAAKRLGLTRPRLNDLLLLLSQKRLSLKAAGCGGFDMEFVWLLSALFYGWSIANDNEHFF